MSPSTKLSLFWIPAEVRQDVLAAAEKEAPDGLDHRQARIGNQTYQGVISHGNV